MQHMHDVHHIFCVFHVTRNNKKEIYEERNSFQKLELELAVCMGFLYFILD